MSGAHGNLKAKSSAKNIALETEVRSHQLLERYAGWEDTRGKRIHVLFMGIYMKTTEHWVRRLEDIENPEYAYLVISRFFELYRVCVLEQLDTPLEDVPGHWYKYHKLSRKLTIKSPISVHLRLISMGVRAHIRHDLAVAFLQAAQDYKTLYGKDVDFAAEKLVILGPDSGDAFKQAVVAYVRQHRDEQTGWRRFVLFWYENGIVLLPKIWFGVVQSWRLDAFSKARSWINSRYLEEASGD